MRGHNLWRLLAAAVVMLLVAACGGSPSDKSVLTFDESVNAALIKVAESGTTIGLRDVTSVEWDEVALFSEGDLLADIEAVVGTTGLKGNRYLSSTNLLVFRKDGQVVAVCGTSADVLDGEYSKLLGADAILRPSHGRKGYVVLTARPV
jgi:hypothetical protein